MQFNQLLAYLVERGDTDRFSDYVLLVSLSLAFKGYGFEEIMEMSVEKIIYELRTPVAPEGWNTMWGDHIVNG